MKKSKISLVLETFCQISNQDSNGIKIRISNSMRLFRDTLLCMFCHLKLYFHLLSGNKIWIKCNNKAATNRISTQNYSNFTHGSWISMQSKTMQQPLNKRHHACGMVYNLSFGLSPTFSVVCAMPGISTTLMCLQDLLLKVGMIPWFHCAKKKQQGWKSCCLYS